MADKANTEVRKKIGRMVLDNDFLRLGHPSQLSALQAIDPAFPKMEEPELRLFVSSLRSGNPGVVAESDAPDENPFLSVGRGLLNSVTGAVSGAHKMLTSLDPMNPNGANNMYDMLVQPNVDRFQKAKEYRDASITEPDERLDRAQKGLAAYNLAASALPIVGPMSAGLAERIVDNPLEGLGETAGTLGMMYLPKTFKSPPPAEPAYLRGVIEKPLRKVNSLAQPPSLGSVVADAGKAAVTKAPVVGPWIKGVTDVVNKYKEANSPPAPQVWGGIEMPNRLPLPSPKPQAPVEPTTPTPQVWKGVTMPQTLPLPKPVPVTPEPVPEPTGPTPQVWGGAKMPAQLPLPKPKVVSESGPSPILAKRLPLPTPKPPAPEPLSPVPLAPGASTPTVPTTAGPTGLTGTMYNAVFPPAPEPTLESQLGASLSHVEDLRQVRAGRLAKALYDNNIDPMNLTEEEEWRMLDKATGGTGRTVSAATKQQVLDAHTNLLKQKIKQQTK